MCTCDLFMEAWNAGTKLLTDKKGEQKHIISLTPRSSKHPSSFIKGRYATAEMIVPGGIIMLSKRKNRSAATARWYINIIFTLLMECRTGNHYQTHPIESGRSVRTVPSDCTIVRKFMDAHFVTQRQWMTGSPGRFFVVVVIPPVASVCRKSHQTWGWELLHR